MAKRRISRLARTEQPIHWMRAFFSGAAGASVMMAFVDIFYLMGFTSFSYEQYLGQILNYSAAGIHNWTVGLFANWFLGGIFGFFYAYFFEFVLRHANARAGARLGLLHALLAAVAFFPFFNAIRDQMGIPAFQSFGFFGAGLGPVTPILLFFSHLVFGTTMGTFYGPVRADRVRYREFEPGERGLPGDPGLISEDESERQAV